MPLKPWSIWATRPSWRSKPLPGAFEDAVANGRAKGIENNVIHIAGSHQQEHLQDFYVTMMPSTSSIVFQNFCIFFSSIGGKNPKGMNRRMFPKKFVRA